MKYLSNLEGQGSADLLANALHGPAVLLAAHKPLDAPETERQHRLCKSLTTHAAASPGVASAVCLARTPAVGFSAVSPAAPASTSHGPETFLGSAGCELIILSLGRALSCFRIALGGCAVSSSASHSP